MINYCPNLREIIYEGNLADWAVVQKMANLDGYLDKVQCLDGYMEYNRENNEWKVGE